MSAQQGRSAGEKSVRGTIQAKDEKTDVVFLRDELKCKFPLG